jgi:iron complex transport system substrate-binding protein
MSHLIKIQRIAAIVLLSLSLCALPLVAQGTPEKTNVGTLSATDAIGNTVELPAIPQRVVIAGRAAVMPADALFLFPESRNMEILLATTDQGLGDFFNLLDPAIAAQKRIGQQVSAEELLALKPDLVLTKTNNYESLAKKLIQFGIPTFVMDLESPTAWNNEILELGKLLGNAQKAQQIIEQFSQREAAVTNAVASVAESDKPRILVMQFAKADGVTAFSVAPKTWIQTLLVEKAGGTPVWLDAELAENAWKKVSFEQIAAWNPDHIYIVSYRSNADSFLHEIRASSQWNQLRAVQNNAVKAFPADVMNYAQPDSRWILALEWLAHDLHPRLFPDFNMEERIAGFYQSFYNVSDTEIIDTLLSAYRDSVRLN